MKKAEKCKTIHEIRECIDQIDKSIIADLTLRAAYVKCAAQFKKSLSEVNADDRVKAMMETRRQWAQEHGINPDFIHSLFDHIVTFFIHGEAKHWKNATDSVDEFTIADAQPEDAAAILGIQKRAYLQEAENAGGDYTIPPITQSLSEMQQDFQEYTILKAMDKSLIVGSVRAKVINTTCHIGRLMVEPIFQKRGYGKLLMKAIESRFSSAADFELFTGLNSQDNIRFYAKIGYSSEDIFGGPNRIQLIRMRKSNKKRN